MQKFSFILLLLPFFSFAQTLSGTVQDTLNNPLPSANVIAKPLEPKKALKFSIADHFGRYKLELEAGTSYEIKVSYLGYQEAIYQCDSFKNFKEYDFKLIEKNEQLQEIVINYEYKPIVVKKDTLIFDVKAFANGNERKLKEVLEKMPGVEVGKDGSVTVQGKKVTQMMVEGKSFFGGGSKLAVENIPADALDKIEVIDHFNKVGFLKQVSDSEDLAMNVKLKEDKKKFIFGDVEAGAEIANDHGYHLLHSALFYYSPQTNVSFIGDLNDIGKETFTFDDLLRFQGGISSFISERKPLSNLYNFVKANKDVLENKSQFAAFNFQQDLSAKMSIEGFGIFSKLFSSSLNQIKNSYLDPVATIHEEQETKEKNKTLLSIGNLKLDYNSSSTSKWFYNTQYQWSANSMNSFLSSIRTGQQNNFETIKEADHNQMKQYIEWHKQYKNKKHTTTLVANQVYVSSKPISTWFTNNGFLTGLIPLQNDSFYHIEQLKEEKNNQMDLLFKHYWILNNSNHLYTSIGNNCEKTKLVVTEKQFLTDGNTIDFFNGGFGNNIKYHLNDFFIGVEYKFKIGNWINKPALFSHFYKLKTNQIAQNYSLSRYYLEPQWSSELEINSSENIKFNYKLSNDFPSVSQLQERYVLQSYNTVFKGNALLSNERFHSTHVRYTKNSMYRGLMLFLQASYHKKTKTIRNTIQLSGIDQFTTPVITTNPETNWRLNGSLNKKIYRFRLQLSANISGFEFTQSLNSLTTTNQRNNQSLGVKLRTATKKWPYLSIGFDKNLSQFKGITKSSISEDVFSFESDINLSKSFAFKIDYQLFYNKNSNQNKTNYTLANAQLSYQKKNHPFRFELRAQNFLNNGTKVNNSFSDYLISNATIYVLPRIFMLNISYKL